MLGRSTMGYKVDEEISLLESCAKMILSSYLRSTSAKFDD
jgi:hypothetical protein